MGWKSFGSSFCVGTRDEVVKRVCKNSIHLTDGSIQIIAIVLTKNIPW